MCLTVAWIQLKTKLVSSKTNESVISRQKHREKRRNDRKSTECKKYIQSCQSLIFIFGVPGGGERNWDRNSI